MSGAEKLFIVMLVLSIVFGVIVYFTHPNYRIKNIYETNKNYYPHITEESVRLNFSKLINKNKTR